MVVDPRRVAEERSLAIHRVIAERLDNEPELLERARARVAGWLATGTVHRYYAEKWREVLARSTSEIQSYLLKRNEEAAALRQVSPFAGALDPRSRWRILKEARYNVNQKRP